MSKAKELAREIKSELPDMGTEEMDMQLRYLVDAVLSEPDEQEKLKGWIEVTDNMGWRKFINTITGAILEDGDAFRVLSCIAGRIILEESYDEIKRKIKEAS